MSHEHNTYCTHRERTERQKERELEVENFILQGLSLMFSQKPVLQLVLEKVQKRDGGGGGGGEELKNFRVVV